MQNKNEIRVLKENHNRRIYERKTLPELKELGKKRGLLNVDKYTKRSKVELVERLVKGKQLSDYGKNVLLEKAQSEGLLANATMSKKVILEKITNPKLTDLGEKRLRQLADKEGIKLRSQMTNKNIIERLNNPTKYYTIESLKRLARNNNIEIKRNISKPELIDVLSRNDIITTTPLQAKESKLGVLKENIPIKLIEKTIKKEKDPIKDLENYKRYIKHLKKENITASKLRKITKTLEKKEKDIAELKNNLFLIEKTAFHGFTKKYVADLENRKPWSKFIFNINLTNILIQIPVTIIFRENPNISVQLYYHVVYIRQLPNGKKLEIKVVFNSCRKIILEGTNIKEVFDEMKNEILEREENYAQYPEGSLSVFNRVIKVELYTAKYYPIKGSSYIDLPPYLKNKKAMINMKNKDNKCFMWSILRALNPIRRDKERIDKNLIAQQHSLNMKDIKFPVSLEDISKFEKQNPTISITVLGYHEKEGVYRLRKSKLTNRKINIVLMLIKDGENSHYCLINNLSALTASQINKHKGKLYTCLNCLNSFNSEEKLQQHKEWCYNNESVKLKMPEKGTILKFKNFLHAEKVPFVIYADFESKIIPINTCQPNPNNSYTTKIQKHKAISFSYYIKCSNDEVCEPILRTYTKTSPEEEDAEDIFIKWLEQDVRELANIEKKEMIFTEEDKEQYLKAADCWICGDTLNNDRVRDHCHYTGRYRGAAHNKCNLKYQKPKFIPVIFHNLSGYDSHLFIKALSETKGNIDCIPNNQQKYISFSKNLKVGEYLDKNNKTHDKNLKIRFIDSLKFLNSSLDVLSNNLPEEECKNLKRYYDGEKFKLVKRKGFYPYEYMDSETKFKEIEPTPQSAFYSRLRGKGISNNDYKHFLNVWRVFNIENLKEYHELYNKVDVLILADVFENFRENSLKYYKLDPAHYFTAPGLAWDAALKITNVNLELLSDVNMLLLFEQGIRGGISMISNRYGKANNKYMGKRFNKRKPSKYLEYVDANNLYGGAMSKKLPTGGFMWMTEKEIKTLFENQIVQVWEKMPSILVVDLEYPKELHDLHSDYPLCAESLQCSGKVKKLIPNLREKKEYVIHYRALMQCLKYGMKLTKIHKGIKFEESEWLKPYIELNTRLRANAKINFEKDFFKLMNNSVFGKTMENIRNRVNVKLANNEEKARKLIAKANYDSHRVFSENLISVHLKKVSLTMNKPVYLGMCILELSKTIMYEFHYEYIKLKYGEKAKLLFTDTDSLMYEIETEDFYKDISGDVEKRFDTSDYPENHPSGIPTGINKKVVGMFKDEANGKIIEEFVGLRAKMYSYKMFEGEENKKCKGIKKAVIKESITHEDYKKCLITQKEQLRKQYILRSYDHEIYGEEINKIALSSQDDKRYILEDGKNTLAWGHYRILENSNSSKN